MERCESGLIDYLGKVATGKLVRGFESLSLRITKKEETSVPCFLFFVTVRYRSKPPAWLAWDENRERGFFYDERSEE